MTNLTTNTPVKKSMDEPADFKKVVHAWNALGITERTFQLMLAYKKWPQCEQLMVSVWLDGARMTLPETKEEQQPLHSTDLSKLCMGHLSHNRVAAMVRSLMRNDLTFEGVLSAGRDRIKWLAYKLEEATTKLEALKIDGYDPEEIIALSRYASGEKPKFSTGVCDSTTAGYGDLDSNGYWQFPLPGTMVRMITEHWDTKPTEEPTL